MASASVQGACKERLESFTYPSATPVYFGYVPPMSAADTPVNPPYILLEDLGTTPTQDFEYNPLETTRLKLTVYATQLSDVDAIASVVRFNGGSVSAALGMDNAATLPLTGMTKKHVTRTQELRGVTTTPNLTAQRVHFCEMSYEVEVLRTA